MYSVVVVVKKMVTGLQHDNFNPILEFAFY